MRDGEVPLLYEKLVYNSSIAWYDSHISNKERSNGTTVSTKSEDYRVRYEATLEAMRLRSQIGSIVEIMVAMATMILLITLVL